MIYKLETNSKNQMEYAIGFFKLNSIKIVVIGTAIIFESNEYQRNQIMYITGCSEGIVTNDDILIAK